MKNLLHAIFMMSSLYGCAQTNTDISGTYDRGQRGDPQGFADLFVLKDHTFVIFFWRRNNRKLEDACNFVGIRLHLKSPCQ